MNTAQIRSQRLSELTKMALRGCTYEEIKVRAYQMASKSTAEQYLAEVVRRVQSK